MQTVKRWFPRRLLSGDVPPKAPALPTIVLDLGGLDMVISRGGQFRYLVDLLRGLHELGPAASFVVLGGSPEPGAELAPLFTSDPTRWQYLPFVRPTGWGSMYREQIRLSATLLKLRADLYHGFHTIIPVLAPCPVVTTILDLMNELFPEYAEAASSRYYRLYRWGVKHRVQRAICISQMTADDAVRLWQIGSERLDVIRLGTTFSERANLTAVEGVSDTSPIILSPYNLEPRKNLAGLVRAFARSRRAADAKLVLFGRAAVTPEREQNFDVLIRELGLGDAIIRTGYVADEQLAWLYRHANLFVFPSLYEGFGYPVLEAMAAGACVITRQASAMAEIVGPAGLLVETADSDLLTSALDRLLANESERARLSEMAIARSREFTVRRMAEQTWRSYESALASTRC